MNEKIPVRNLTPDSSQSMYAKRHEIYTRSFSGIFRNIRMIFGGLLFLLYFGTAWINYEGRQAVLFDLPERKFYIFGATFWPQDFFLLSWVLIICAFGLFFITVYAGRVWCGYACPQSVWTWLYMWTEKITCGDRPQRMKMDKNPLTANVFLRKTIKHIIWLTVAVFTGFTFVGYFTPIRELAPDLLLLNVSGWAFFWIAFFTLATYLNAGWMREQVCIYMCPYARFQSVMFDKDTLIVSYDAQRGDPRGPRKKGTDFKENGLGECIDCTMCVQVCPTGIDIRDGLQIACWTCAACIDACDDIMEKMNYPKGLIRYTTEHNLNGNVTKLARPRLIGYATVLIVMIAALGWAINTRPLVKLDVLKDRGVMYRENAQGLVENVYSLRIMNKDQRDHTFVISVQGIDGLGYEGNNTFTVKAGDLITLPAVVTLNPDQIKETTNDIEFHIEAEDDPSINEEVDNRFMAPDYQ